MLVSQLINRNGNPNANQFVISDNGLTAFQSYDSRVCEIRGREVTFGCDWDYSRTTLKHLYTFLDDNGLSSLRDSKSVRKAIKEGKTNEGYKVLYDPNLR